MTKHKNSRQEDALIQFMEHHADVARGYTRSSRIDVDNLWTGLVKDLNSLGPPMHDVTGWKKVWTGWKAGVKKKIATNIKEAKATGGGPYNQIYISKKYELVGQICGLYAIVEGIQNSNSFGVDESIVNETSSDESIVDEQPSTSKELQIGGKRKRNENNLNENPSTSKRTPLGYKNTAGNVKELLKTYMETDTKTSKELSDSVKIFSETSQKIVEKLDIIGGNVRRVYKSVENLTSVLTNELKRHHLQMEKAAIEKNNLKQLDIEIKQKQLQLEQLKESFNKK